MHIMPCFFEIFTKYYFLIAIVIDSLPMQVSFARPSSENIKGANLYVSGIPKTMCQSELETLFAPFGRIITSRILCDSITGIWNISFFKSKFCRLHVSHWCVLICRNSFLFAPFLFLNTFKQPVCQKGWGSFGLTREERQNVPLRNWMAPCRKEPQSPLQSSLQTTPAILPRV